MDVLGDVVGQAVNGRDVVELSAVFRSLGHAKALLHQIALSGARDVSASLRVAV